MNPPPRALLPLISFSGIHPEAGDRAYPVCVADVDGKFILIIRIIAVIFAQQRPLCEPSRQTADGRNGRTIGLLTDTCADRSGQETL